MHRRCSSRAARLLFLLLCMTEESLLSQVRSGYGRKRKFFHNYQRSREFDYLDMVDAKKNRLTEELKDVKVSWSTVEELRSNVFDIPSFREGGGSLWQGETIRRVLDGQSTLFISATGSGKSLTYLLPTVAMKNKGSITLVISPLLALIKDQLLGCLTRREKQLKSLPYCIRGACLSSEMNELEISEVNREVVKDLMKNVDRINLACIDEAHCASSWAHHFRPSYLRLGRFLTEKLKVRCILGLTATSTARVTNQICRLLFIPKDGVVYSSTIRPNLHVSVLRVNREVETLETIISSLPILFENSITSDIVEGQEKSPSFSTILYCSTQALCEKLATSLKKRGFRALPYHGAMKNQDRRANQDAFFSNEVQIIVATVAFGMGINKKDIRAVIHYNSPSSIEEWSQQIGRAGR
ncbi:hypothetical protein GUITHDRAFT_145101 [Guillardia theta CCMP2712]|uniref:DNA 3'-5' helicase n=1 Tax=Guillardia theta (strain CCMP2712) TaxID=905079 RepID=L1IMZ2_GUITC|nr:hypothetical protein GUITHDRAFT_145101 [Guillardia theta CCMP2712]EKX37259.1 hypothetical protein GUITHDRAFT_145101 [Guillardia theta CCMP2712]|eukprot:XP_005824239.1 hypothetical protein GUITHDRAFT_145101 [Guillardia theta CCMP2712]